MLQHFSNPSGDAREDDIKSRRSIKSLAALSVSVILTAVFFSVLLYSIQFAKHEVHRVYSVVHERTQVFQEIAMIDNMDVMSYEDAVQNADMQIELSTVTSIACLTKQDAAIKNNDAPHPDDSSTDVLSEQKSTKASVKSKEAAAPATSAGNTKSKSKVVPYSQKTKNSGQKHFGVGLRFTI